MSGDVAPSHPLTPIASLRPRRSRELAREREMESDGVREAHAICPTPLLQGCREALQRIGRSARGSYGITSALRGEGRSSIAAALATVEWLDGEKRVVLVDLDLEKPSLHRRFALPEGLEIGSLVRGHRNVEDCLQRIFGDVWLLSVGCSAEDAPRGLNQLASSSLMSQLSEWADVTVFDLPPLLASVTGAEAARLCATPIMVVRAGVSPLPQVKEAVERLPAPPPVIVNGVRSAVPAWLRRSLGVSP